MRFFCDNLFSGNMSKPTPNISNAMLKSFTYIMELDFKYYDESGSSKYNCSDNRDRYLDCLRFPYDYSKIFEFKKNNFMYKNKNNDSLPSVEEFMRYQGESIYIYPKKNSMFSDLTYIIYKNTCNIYMKNKTFVPKDSCKVDVSKTISNIYNQYNEDLVVNEGLQNMSKSSSGFQAALNNMYLNRVEGKSCKVDTEKGICTSDEDLLSCKVDAELCYNASGMYKNNQCLCKDNQLCQSDNNSSDVFKLHMLEENENCIFPVGIRGVFNYGCNKHNNLICQSQKNKKKKNNKNYGRCVKITTLTQDEEEDAGAQLGCDRLLLKAPWDLARCGKALGDLEEVTEVDEGLVLLDEIPVEGEVLMATEAVSEGAAVANVGVKCHNVLSDITDIISDNKNCGINKLYELVQKGSEIYNNNSNPTISVGFV